MATNIVEIRRWIRDEVGVLVNEYKPKDYDEFTILMEDFFPSSFGINQKIEAEDNFIDMKTTLEMVDFIREKLVEFDEEDKFIEMDFGVSNIVNEFVFWEAQHNKIDYWLEFQPHDPDFWVTSPSP